MPMSAQAIHPGAGRLVADPGPLAVSAANPGYFTIRSGDAAGLQLVYLTGSHVWNNFHDGLGPGRDCAGTPEQLETSAAVLHLGRTEPTGALDADGTGGALGR